MTRIAHPGTRVVATLAAGLLVAAGSLLGATPAYAATVTFTDPSSGISYTADDASSPAVATASGYDFAVGGTDVVIPETVTHDSIIYTVTEIGSSAFSDSSLVNSVTSVSIPNTVTTIGGWAFGWSDMTSLVIPDSVTEIGERAFWDSNLESLTLSNSLISIGDRTFGQNNLTSVVFPASVTSIGIQAFYNNKLASAIFLGPAPTTFGAMVFVDGSLGSNIGLTVYYPHAYDALLVPGGYTAGTWKGYTTLPNPVVTFDVGEHGDAVDPAEVVFSYTATAPAPSAAGWDFTGWYTDAAFTVPYDFATPVTADITLYGGWAVAAPVDTGGESLAAAGSELAVPLALGGSVLLLFGVSSLAFTRLRRSAMRKP